jgi:hypothetical protein
VAAGELAKKTELQEIPEVAGVTVLHASRMPPA